MEEPKITVIGRDQPTHRAVKVFNQFAKSSPEMVDDALHDLVSGVEPALKQVEIADAAVAITDAWLDNKVKFDDDSWLRFSEKETKRQAARAESEPPVRHTLFRYLGFYARELTQANGKPDKSRRAA